MLVKDKIINELGEDVLLLPTLVNSALLANDQAKYYFSLFQTARSHLLHPEIPLESLHSERLAAGVEDAGLDNFVASAERLTTDSCRIDQALRVYNALVAAIEAMLAPIEAATRQPGNRQAPPDDDYRQRLEELQQAAPAIADDILPLTFIDEMTHGDRQQGDSFHLLVMDLHRRLNQLQQDLAEENIDGASAYQTTAEDRPLIAAFMRGLNRTAPLKFDHPGLGTTATRIGEKLVLQNDIGTTDAHVLVIHVTPSQITFTYTDVHLNRLQFFKNLFRTFDIDWSDTSTRAVEGYENENYYLTVARFTAGKHGDLEKYLDYLGSRLVFLIDWNKARKRLRNFIRNRDGVKLLEWAAQNDLGQRGFLEMGGEQLIYDAIEYAAGGQVLYGKKLSDLLGREQCIEFLRFVLQAGSQGLRAGRSHQLIRDSIKTELLKYFRTGYQTLFSLAERHAELIHDIASGLHSALLRASTSEAADYVQRMSLHARRWEHEADDILNEIRALVGHADHSDIFQQVMEHADDAADSLEESAFLLTLLPAGSSRKLYEPLKKLSALLVEASQAFVTCLESARDIQRSGEQLDMEDFLGAVDRIVGLEHDTDSANRAVTAAIVQDSANHGELHVFSELSRTQEEAADSLARSCLLVRDYVLNEVIRT